MLKTLTLTCLLLVSLAFTQSVESLKDCYVSQSDKTLTIGNNKIQRDFLWNNGHLISSRIASKNDGAEILLQDNKPDVTIGELTQKALSGEWTSKIVESAIEPQHLQIEVLTTFKDIELKRVFRVYPDCPVIGCDYFLRATHNITEIPKETVLQSFQLPGQHWKFKAVEFYDRTDVINNLVFETSIVAYKNPKELRGNILYGENLLGGAALFMLKEAPCSFVQLNYPGYDFKCSIGSVEAVGMGMSADDLHENEWIKVYGLATGLCQPSDVEFLTALRSYQKQLRRLVPERDDMIMMNTWGDRNKDARIGEEFVNAQVDACAKLGISHLQIDDGWQQGLSKNSSVSKGKLWDQWDEASWQPNTERFPNGFTPVVKHARELGVDLGLWFHPSNANDYEKWQQDANIIINLYTNFGVRYFKIDGIKLPTKKSEINLRKFFDAVLKETNGEVVFNLDATADNRGGYHYFYEYGNIFLENRYTDFTRYYPHWTLRNLWMLSKYVAPEKLQIEFLNKWRNADKYDKGDPLAPSAIPFDYQFAVTMMAQPLAWFEGSELPEEGMAIAPLIKKYRSMQTDIHKGTILPIGDEPSGTSWTGFQSILDENKGFVQVFREHNDLDHATLSLYRLAGKTINFEHIAGDGRDFQSTVNADGSLSFSLPAHHTFALYRYHVKTSN